MHGTVFSEKGIVRNVHKICLKYPIQILLAYILLLDKVNYLDLQPVKKQEIQTDYVHMVFF